MSDRHRAARIAVAIAATFVLGASTCLGDEPLDRAEAQEKLRDLLDDVDWQDVPVTRRASVQPPGSVDFGDTLPPIAEFPIVVRAPAGAGVVAEVFASTEKSGTGTDGWLVEVADAFNDAGLRLSDGRTAAVDIRSIASGTGYQFIAAGRHLPAGFTPSNHLWVEMAAAHLPMTSVSERLAPNVAGIVMESQTAQDLREKYGELDTASLIEAVVAGDMVMGYTDPFASSTGLNFLLTVLDAFAEGDESRLLAPDVASVFEQFQQQVPFVALTTLQIRDSVEREGGSLDAFVMEYQTFSQTESLSSGFEFIPFGVRHDNPLYAVGDVPQDRLEVLELFASFVEGQQPQGRARRFGFDPPPYTSDVTIPSGETLIRAQQLWKDKKDGGRPVAAVFVSDVSGSMGGTRIQAVQQALLSASEFIRPDSSIGMVEFNDSVRLRLPIAPFDLNQQGRFVAAAEDMDADGGTAMYDAITLALSMLLEHQRANPDAKLLLLVLTDGETNRGMTLGDVDEVITGLRIPVYTVGFEADLEELGNLSSLVEAASIDASEADVEFKIAGLMNAQV